MYSALLVLALVFGVGAEAVAGELYQAAAAGDLSAVEQLLASGAAVDAPDRNGETPLMAAALADRPEIAELLVSRGADLSARNAGGFSPLHAAAYSGSIAVATILLDRGAAIEDTANKAHASPLMVAADEGRAGVVDLLILRGADINSLDKDGYSPLSQAWSKKHVDVVRMLKQHGAACQSVEVLGGEVYYQGCVSAGL